ncbi:hypothetical protein LTR78_005984 [Recurvomyces mirabilis]|uniref:Mid2 domain-containing protein n=1 Tax=Recurvomyces mirabilis TaxID=574656 RepID=A0AAE1C0M8_9PEZI|nr:hypothetical protein LTR78_005984 [Recurvomyces mirabilis]
MVATTAVIAVLALLCTTQSLAQKQCYWPNHAPAANYTACNAAGDQSHCCRKHETCLTNGLCLQTQGLANRESRGACTDNTFSSPACPQACADAYDDVTNNGAFCCVLPYNSTTGRCPVSTKGSTTPFDLDPFQVIVDRSNGATLPIDGTDYVTTSNATSTGSTAETTVYQTTTATAQASIAPIAAGIAAPLGILLIAALIACGVLFSQVRKLRRQVDDQGQAHTRDPPGAAPSYDYKIASHDGRSQEAQPLYHNAGWGGHGGSPPPQIAPVEAPASTEVTEADSRPVGKFR